VTRNKASILWTIHLVKRNNKCRTVFKENLTETSLTALNVSTILPTIVACALSLLPISLCRITSSFSQNYLQTIDHVILPQFFLFAVFSSYFTHLIPSYINQRLVALSVSLYLLQSVAAPGGGAAGGTCPGCKNLVPRQLSYSDVDHKRIS